LSSNGDFAKIFNMDIALVLALVIARRDGNADRRVFYSTARILALILHDEIETPSDGRFTILYNG
jgi:hypothetical protein